MSVFLLLLAAFLFASLQEQVDQRYIQDEYEKWKRNQR
jgi:hypothetical protein